MLKNGMRPVHPGEILFEEFMKPSDPPINANRFAKALEAPANRVTAIIKGQRAITGGTAMRLAASGWSESGQNCSAWKNQDGNRRTLSGSSPTGPSRMRKYHFDTLEFRWSARVAQQENHSASDPEVL